MGNNKPYKFKPLDPIEPHKLRTYAMVPKPIKDQMKACLSSVFGASRDQIGKALWQIRPNVFIIFREGKPSTFLWHNELDREKVKYMCIEN